MPVNDECACDDLVIHDRVESQAGSDQLCSSRVESSAISSPQKLFFRYKIILFSASIKLLIEDPHRKFSVRQHSTPLDISLQDSTAGTQHHNRSAQSDSPWTLWQDYVVSYCTIVEKSSSTFYQVLTKKNKTIPTTWCFPPCGRSPHAEYHAASAPRPVFPITHSFHHDLSFLNSLVNPPYPPSSSQIQDAAFTPHKSCASRQRMKKEK